MKLFLSPDLKVNKVKREFEREFPYLKIEFARKKNELLPESPVAEIISPARKLINVSGIMREGEIIIKSTQTVNEIVQLFQSKFFLPVQIFRKTMCGWVETTDTGDFSLAKNNRIAREVCNAMYDEEVLL